MRFVLSTLILLIFMFPLHAFSQKISGKVWGESGKAAASVSVKFINSSNTVLTNKDGGFTIIAKKLPDTLVFSAAGYESYKVVVTSETLKDPNFEVVLLSSRTKYTEGIVTASAARKKDAPADSVLAYSDLSTMVYEKSPITPREGRTGPIRLRGSYYTRASGEYLEGKKLFLIDSIPEKKDVVYKSGLLTAGELNDFNKWKMWQDFQENQFSVYSQLWDIYPRQRYSVQLQNKDHISIAGQTVYLVNKKTNDTVWSAVTDNTGKCELWANMNGKSKDDEYIIVHERERINSPTEFSNGVNKLQLNKSCQLSNTIDIAFVVDATGSMTDEIDFLKLELEDAIRNTFSQFSNLDLHVSSVFYRDKNDEYLTHHIDFQTDLLKVLNFIKLQRAGGGGDTPEAVDEALSMALDSLRWSSTARSRILFLILDAPPHAESKDRIFELIKKAAANGVRIIPVVCSGADKSTEFIMRSISLATNGSYIFLTDNSNIGLAHEKPTTDHFNVEFLNSILQRVIKQMIFANQCSENEQPEVYKTTPLNIENVKIYPNPSRGNFSIESKKELRELFITDFTGKILMRIELNSKQSKWNVNLSSYPNGTYLVKYITPDDRWGAERVVIIH